MTNQPYDVVIVGAGLSGLASAILCHEAGKSVCILEARPIAGGRIRSIFDDSGDYLADLGPTWIWPEFQPVISNWIEKLNLQTFPQFDTGNTILDYGSGQEPEVRFLPSQQESMRIVGGSQALIDVMISCLPKAALLTNTKVEAISASKNAVHIQTANTDFKDIHAHKLIVATPPRIALNTIEWNVDLPKELINALNMTPTWMAPHAKVAIIYEAAFWRNQGLSGRIASRAGPIGECHDHSSLNASTTALWGFIAWPHDMRIEMGLDKLKAEVKLQLKRCFGDDSPEPISVTIEEWSQDPFVTSPNDLSGPIHHPNVGPDSLRQSYVDNRIWFAGAETAQRSPGLIEGAFDSANRVAANILTD